MCCNDRCGLKISLISTNVHPLTSLPVEYFRLAVCSERCFTQELNVAIVDVLYLDIIRRCACLVVSTWNSIASSIQFCGTFALREYFSPVTVS